MPEHRCARCGNHEVIRLATCHASAIEQVMPGEPVGYVHCPDCHHDTPWHLSTGQNHLVCSNRGGRRNPREKSKE